MSSSLQTIIALVIVVTALALLLRATFQKRKNSSCGSEGCGAISADVKKLKAKLKR